MLQQIRQKMWEMQMRLFTVILLDRVAKSSKSGGEVFLLLYDCASPPSGVRKDTLLHETFFTSLGCNFTLLQWS